MDLLKKTIDMSNNTIQLLVYQDKQINNIILENKNIENKISLSEQLLNTIKSFFYRITYTPLPINTDNVWTVQVLIFLKL